MEQTVLIISVMTAMAVCLLIINKTLKSNNAPCLMVPQSNVHFYWEKQGKENMFPELWSKGKRGNQDLKDMHVHYLDCLNIGAGAAKDIEVSWEYDTDEFIRLIKRLDIDKVVDVNCTDDKLMFSIKYPRSKYPKHPDICSQSMPRKNSENIDYVLPVNAGKEPVQITTNRNYLMLASLYYYVLYLNHGCLESDFFTSFLAKLPECRLGIKYRDLANHKHQSSFKLSLNAMEHEMHSKPKHGGFFMWARIKVEPLL